MPGDAEHLGGAPLDLLELVPNGSPLEEVGRDVREERRLTPPLLRLDRSAAGAGRELADDDRRARVDGEREPVLAVRQRERVDRRQEEEVEGEHAADRNRQREREPPLDGHGQDGEDVEHAQAEDGHEAPEEEDGARHRGNREEARD